MSANRSRILLLEFVGSLLHSLKVSLHRPIWYMLPPNELGPVMGPSCSSLDQSAARKLGTARLRSGSDSL